MTPQQRAQKENHPKNGSVLKVDPIRDLKDVQRIKAILVDRPRDLALFTVGVNTALRGSDLVKLTGKDIEGLQPGGHITVRMEKTDQLIQVTINEAAWLALQSVLPENPTSPLFPSEKTGQAMTRAHLGRLVKGWCGEIGLKGRFASHTLRKTWGSIQYFTFKTPLSVISKALGHQNETVTRAYLGIQPEDVRDAFMKVI